MLVLTKLDHEHLADGELARAALCGKDDGRNRHLNRAAVYAHRGEKAGPGARQAAAVLDLLMDLSAALDVADGLELTMIVTYIDQAIVGLGGIGSLPHEPAL